MEEIIENVIRKVIIKKYPFLTLDKVVDKFSDLPNLRYMTGNLYVCRFKSDECLSEKEHMEIDTEVKNLFKMLGFESNNIRQPEISCFFDCGEGYEFKMTRGYNH